MQFHIKIKSKILARMDMKSTEALNYGSNQELTHALKQSLRLAN